MHRFFVPDVQARDSISLPATEARHAIRVLRLASGESVTLLDGQGGEYHGCLDVVGPLAAEVRIQTRSQHPPPATQITLIQAIAKGAAMEGLIHRAVELGCGRLVPLLADRSVSRPDDASAKQTKWQTIADEALKQSGNPWRMTVESPVGVREWLARRESFELLLIASLESEPRHPHDWLEQFSKDHGRPPRTLGILIGPEGDFTAEEYAAFRSAGARPTSLGPYVLRVETAAIAALAAVQSHLRPSESRSATAGRAM